MVKNWREVEVKDTKNVWREEVKEEKSGNDAFYFFLNICIVRMHHVGHVGGRSAHAGLKLNTYQCFMS